MNDKGFSELSSECRRHLKSGRLDLYAIDLKCMGDILGREDRHIDELKVLMLAFYIDLSGVHQQPFIDRELPKYIRSAVIRSELDAHQFRELYMETVRTDTTPSHVMTVNDSLYLLELCLSNREDAADGILAELTEHECST